MKILISLSLIIIYVCCSAVQAKSILWKKQPIKIELSIDQEEVIRFPIDVADVNIDRQTSEKSSIDVLYNGLYWTAKQSFEKSRIEVTLVNQQIIILDVVTTNQSTDNETIINFEKNNNGIDNSDDKNTAPHIVDVVRHAAQQVHGPKRLVEPLNGMVLLSNKRTTIPHLYRYNEFDTSLIAQWRYNTSSYVYVVEVANKTSRMIRLSPSLFRGQWTFAAAHHKALQPKGIYGDTSFVYLVSDSDSALESLHEE